MKKLLLPLLILFGLTTSAQSIYQLKQDSIILGLSSGNSAIALPGKKFYIKDLPKGNITVRGDGKIIHNDTAYVAKVVAPADTTQDSFDLVQNAVNSSNGYGTIVLDGNFYFNKSLAGGILLPANARGILIEMTAGSKIKLSRNVPRAFDMVGGFSTTVATTYKNITLRNILIDANNIDGTAMAPPVTVVTGGIGDGINYIDINVGNTSGFLQSGICYLPYENTGSVKDKFRKFQKKAGSSTTLQILLGFGETILTGDIVKGGANYHVIIGPFSKGGTDSDQYNLIMDNIELDNVRAINVPTEYFQSEVAGDHRAATQRLGVMFSTVQSSGYPNTLTITNIRINEVHIEGGFFGFCIGSYSGAPNPVFMDNISVTNSSHDTKFTYNIQTFSANLLIGGQAFGNNAYVSGFIGKNSGDAGIEINGMMNSVISNNQVYNAQGSAFPSGNYNYPAPTAAGPLSTTLSTGLTNIATSMTVASIPDKVPYKGWLTIGPGTTFGNTELVYYTRAYGSNTLDIVRGMNNTTNKTFSSGAAVKFVETDKQIISYSNNKVDNTTIISSGATGGIGWLVNRNDLMFLPPPNIKTLNDTYKRVGPEMGYFGEVFFVLGHPGFIDISGLKANISGVNNPTNNNLTAGAIRFKDTDYGSNITTVPQVILRVQNSEITSGGSLNLGPTNKSFYNGIITEQGNYLVDFLDNKVSLNFYNTVGLQSYGIDFGFQTNYISGNIRNFKFSNNGDPEPYGIFASSSTTFNKPLYISGLDFTDMYYLVDATNSKYHGTQFESSRDNVFITGPILTPKIATTPISSFTEHQRRLSTSATLNFSDNYVGVTGGSGVVLTLPAVTVTATTSRQVNDGTSILIVDESNNAATNNITIAAAAGETINGASTYTINVSGSRVYLNATKSGWVASIQPQPKLTGTGLVKSTSGVITYVVPGTGVESALQVNVGSAGAPVLYNGALGTPSSGIGTNLTGTAAGLTAGSVTNGMYTVGGNTYSGTQLLTGAFSQYGGNSFNQFSATPVGSPSTSMSPGGIKLSSTDVGTTDYYSVDYSGFKRDIGGSVYTYTGPALSGTIALTSQLTSGTVTNVSSANADIGIATGSSTPVLTLNSGTSANQIVKRDASGFLGINTTSNTHSLTFGSTSTGIANYNTVNQTTDYERIRTYWNSNIYTIASENLGTGTLRDININAGSSVFTIGNASLANGYGFTIARSGTGLNLLNILSTGLSSSNSLQTAVGANITFTQSGSASYNVFFANVTETSTGSGAKNLFKGDVGGVNKFQVSNAGVVTAAGAINGVSPTVMGYLTNITSDIQAQVNAKGSGTVTNVTGTTNRITVATGTTTPVIDISGSYVGQSSITTLGTIGTGIWQGTPIADSYISSATTWNAKQSAITFGTGVQTALGVNIGSSGAVVVNGGALGTPSSGVATNLTGTAAGLSIGGSAASLSAASTLPNNTLATTQSPADNSTKVATTAYVDAAADTRASYSEGTWTPTQNGANPPSSAVGYYTKIGNIVRATFSLFLASNTSSSSFTISNLPFTNSNNVASYGAISLSGTDVGIPIMGIVPTNTAIALFSDYSGSAITITQMSGKYISGVITYSTTN